MRMGIVFYLKKFFSILLVSIVCINPFICFASETTDEVKTVDNYAELFLEFSKIYSGVAEKMANMVQGSLLIEIYEEDGNVRIGKYTEFLQNEKKPTGTVIKSDEFDRYFEQIKEQHVSLIVLYVAQDVTYKYLYNVIQRFEKSAEKYVPDLVNGGVRYYFTMDE